MGANSEKTARQQFYTSLERTGRDILTIICSMLCRQGTIRSMMNIIWKAFQKTAKRLRTLKYPAGPSFAIFFAGEEHSSQSGLIRMGKVTSDLSTLDVMGDTVEISVEIISR